jgi:hypothetical protein
LLAVPPTVTTTLPEVAPDGTAVTIFVSVQLLAEAVVPLNVIELPDCVTPKPDPTIATEVPTGPANGDKLAMFGVLSAMLIVVVWPATTRLAVWVAAEYPLAVT